MNEDEELLEMRVGEPQVTSDDPFERKLARQLRISKRNEVAARRATQEGVKELVEHVEKTELEKQVEQSAEELERLLLEGRELVTNVRVASDTREVNRRQEETENRKKRLQRLEEEENTTKEMFEEVSCKWESMSHQNDPMDLKVEIDAQKERCKELLEHKNAVIRDLIAELEAADVRFVKDQQRQLKEVSLLVERIENQVKIMKNAYLRELQLIEDAISNERKDLMDSCTKHWESLYKQRDKEEVNMLSLRFQEQDNQDDMVKQVRTENQEKYRQTKIKLDTDIEVLHHELEQVKAMCLLNSEKLDYNYQVLQKREDENLMMRAQQKRRINKLQDIANNLRRKMRESQASADIETTRLYGEINRLHQNIADIEKKANHFAEVNDFKYHQVWDLHQDAANKLVSKITVIDRLIHEQQLGLEWIPLPNVLLEKTDLPSFQSAIKLVNGLFRPKIEAATVGEESAEAMAAKERGKFSLEEEAQQKDSEITFRQRVLKLVLQRVADNAGFLVEEQLKDLLAPYTSSQQAIVLLDNIFTALGLRYESDIEMLKEFFLPYAVCTVCKKSSSADAVTTEEDPKHLVDLSDTEHTSEASEQLERLSSEKTTSASIGEASPMKQTKIPEDRTGAGSLPSGASVSPQQPHILDKACRENHPLEIDSVYVLQALRNFIAKFQQNQLGDLKSISFLLSQKRNTVSRLLTRGDVTDFWTRYEKVFPKSRERLWEGFTLALNKYHIILCERHKLNKEAKALKKQNSELKRLLDSYMKSSVTEGGNGALPPLNR